MFKVLGVDHIGIAVTDLKEVGSFWSEALGLPANGEETVAEQKVTTGFFPTPNGSEIELLAATEDSSPIAKFIEKNNGRGGIQ
ncbi:VOC family protein, partial [Mitsuokella jalaludinii]